MDVLQTHDLHKTYGRITAVNKLNLSIPKGSVFGLLGPNGSGKTTTLGMILGVTNPSGGDFLWFQKKADHNQRKRVGAILEKPNFYPNFSAVKNLELVCKIKQVASQRIGEVLALVGLEGRKNDSFRTYSLGMKQRLAIGSALLADPEVLILDEPTNGLDPQGIADIRDLIIEIGLTGKTIILASHLLDDVQKVCSEFAVLKNGNLIFQGSVDEGFGDQVIIEVGAGNLIELEEALQTFPGYLSHRMQKDSVRLSCEPDVSAATLNKFLAEQGLYLSHLNQIKKNLEQQFLEILSEHA
jgi:ABC-2 type transport system ATP-binding protein